MRTWTKNLSHDRATPALLKGVNSDGSRPVWEAPTSSSLMVGLGGHCTRDLANGKGECVCEAALRVILTPETASFSLRVFLGWGGFPKPQSHGASSPSRGLRSPGRPRFRRDHAFL